jgi:type II secretory pathway pseudopilin PulG
MKKGGKQKGTDGFTVVEVLIVLAVTSVLFVSVALTISGRQRKTEFAVGVRNIQQQLQQIINETESGYFPDSGNFRCSAHALGITITNTPTEQGTNSDCIFVGKAMIIGGDAHRDNFNVYSLAGSRRSNGADVTTLADAHVTAIAGSTANPDAPNIIDRVAIQNGLDYVWARLGDTAQVAQTQPAGIAVVSTLANFKQSSNVSTATQSFELYRIASPGWGNSGDTSAEANVINANAWSGNRIPSAQLCFASGGTDQSGLITIGTKGGAAGTTSVGGLQVHLEIKMGKTCGA